MPDRADSPAVTILLSENNAAADRIGALLPLVYDQLRKAAQINLAGERPGHTLSATALVHEAYLKLIGPRDIPWQNRAHFYAAAAQAMRQILLDHARTTARRGGPMKRLTQIGDISDLADAHSEQIVAVDAALIRLEREDPQAAAIVRLRFYAGLSVDQAAAALGLSPRSAARLWTYSRAVLYQMLGEDS